jgi:hypothetical protein
MAISGLRWPRGDNDIIYEKLGMVLANVEDGIQEDPTRVLV